MARARACPSVVLPTPGTPSMSRCPRAKIETRARRTTSSLPRITRRRAFSSSAALLETALWDTALAVSGDILSILLLAAAGERVTDVHGAGYQLSAVSSQPNNRLLVSRGMTIFLRTLLYIEFAADFAGSILAES